MTENFESEHTDPITDLDIAGYFSGYLSSSRSKEVKRFLQQNSDVAEAAQVLQGDTANQTITDELKPAQSLSKDELPTDELRRRSPAQGPQSTLGRRPKLLRSISRFAVALMLIVSVVAAFHLIQSQAVAERLDRVQALVKNRQTLDSRVEQDDALQTLQDIGSSFFVSSKNERRRQWLLALLNFQMAEREFQSARKVNPASQLIQDVKRRYDRIFAILSGLGSLSAAEQELMINALFERSRIMYQLATLEDRSAPDSLRDLNDAATGLLDALDLIDRASPKVIERCEVAVAALLVRTLRKGAAPHLKNSNSSIGIRLNRRFQDVLAGSETQLEDIGRHCLKMRFSGRRGVVGHLDLYNVLGMQFNNSPGSPQEGVACLEKAITVAENFGFIKVSTPNLPMTLQKTFSDDIDLAIVCGRLFGNLADGYVATNQVKKELKARKDAINLLQAARYDSPSVEISFELKWLLGRQLLLLVNTSTEPIASHQNALLHLGQLRETTTGLTDFRGSQLSPWEEFALRAINAESATSLDEVWQTDFLENLPEATEVAADNPNRRMLIRTLECCLKQQVILDRPEISQKIQNYLDALQ